MASDAVSLNITGAYLWCVAGIVISIVLPILRAFLPRPPTTNKQGEEVGFWAAFWEQARPFVVVGLFSLLTGLLIVAFTWGAGMDWRAALLAGYAWDSTLQKLTKP